MSQGAGWYGLMVIPQSCPSGRVQPSAFGSKPLVSASFVDVRLLNPDRRAGVGAGRGSIAIIFGLFTMTSLLFGSNLDVFPVSSEIAVPEDCSLLVLNDLSLGLLPWILFSRVVVVVEGFFNWFAVALMWELLAAFSPSRVGLVIRT